MHAAVPARDRHFVIVHRLVSWMLLPHVQELVMVLQVLMLVM